MIKNVTFLLLALVSVTGTPAFCQVFHPVMDGHVRGEVVCDLHQHKGLPIPKVSFQVLPIYPLLAKRENIDSRVVVIVQSQDNGEVTAFIRVHKVGAKEYGFDRAALEAVRQWKFNGPGTLEVEFRFR